MSEYRFDMDAGPALNYRFPILCATSQDLDVLRDLHLAAAMSPLIA
jgi:hypothetical protein